MGVGYKRTLTTGDIPVFQIAKPIVLLQGGFALDTTGLTAGTVIKAGHPMIADEAARTAKPLPTATMYEAAGSTATDYKVNKGHTLKVGDNFAAATGNKAYAITAINTSNAAYDVVTVGTTIGAVAAGATVFASATTGTSNSALPDGRKGLLYSDVVVAPGESVSVAVEAHVYARRVPYNASLEAAMPGIYYSQSF